MTLSLPPITFYLPPSHWLDDLPTSADENWQGFGIGIYAWTVQTYLRLRADGFPCELSCEFPRSGIVLMHRNALLAHQDRLKPDAGTFIVCMKADIRPYAYAQMHVVQNPVEVKTLEHSYYLPHWSQPGLIPRDPARGDRLETVAFFGHQANLAPELRDPGWRQALEAMGLSWQPIANRNRWNDYSQIDHRWNDYSQVDAVVAVRSFHLRQRYLHQDYITKPATKLYNAWLAGVPAILGCEAAYRAERRSPLDYLEVGSAQELLAAIARLRDNPSLRHDMMANAKRRAREVHPTATTARWREFLETVAVPAYHRWIQQTRWQQQLALGCSYLGFNAYRVRQKLRPLVATIQMSLAHPTSTHPNPPNDCMLIN